MILLTIHVHEEKKKGFLTCSQVCSDTLSNSLVNCLHELTKLFNVLVICPSRPGSPFLNVFQFYKNYTVCKLPLEFLLRSPLFGSFGGSSVVHLDPVLFHRGHHAFVNSPYSYGRFFINPLYIFYLKYCVFSIIQNKKDPV